MKYDVYNKSASKKLVFIALIVMLMLTACRQDEVVKLWEGQWQRTIHVPRGIQGRCVDEELTIDKKTWRLKATIYPTFQCSQAYLELTYSGNLEQIEIKNGTDNRQMVLVVGQISLTEMVDISGDERSVLSGAGLRALDAQYIPASHRSFRQKVLLGGDHQTLRSDIYWPLLNLAISEYPNIHAQLTYKRR